MLFREILLTIGITYLSLSLGTFLKFIDNNLRGKVLLWTPVIPLYLFVCHSKLAVKILLSGRIKKASREFVYPIVQFPVAVGTIIEVILEAEAASISRVHAEQKKGLLGSEETASMLTAYQSLHSLLGITKNLVKTKNEKTIYRVS